MAVTLANADSALKNYYLDAVAEQIKFSNPFLSQIKYSTENVYGKEVKKLATFGINGGIGAGTEDGNLPTPAGNNYAQMTSTLKNLYGTIEISDKAIRASENNAGAFVNLLNAEMEGLVKASTFNLGRMIYGKGDGILGKVAQINNGILVIDNVKGLQEGMVLDFISPVSGEVLEGGKGRRIKLLDKLNRLVLLAGDRVTSDIIPLNSLVAVQGSHNNEITGFGAIFDVQSTPLYGLSRDEHTFLTPYKRFDVGELSERILQVAIDSIEETSGGTVNYIVCSLGVRRALQKMFSESGVRVNTVELEGGFKAMSYNGIPIVADRLCPAGTMYLLNTEDFVMHQLCDWQWLESEDGKILRQVPGKPVYTATLVKYAELMCERPCGQGILAGITEVN